MVHIDQAAVAMSPQHFKTFVLSMNATLEAYEATFGALNIPDVITKPKNSAAHIQKMLTDKLDSMNAAKSSDASTAKKQPSKRSRGAS
jgi:uncharacterized protein YciW